MDSLNRWPSNDGDGQSTTVDRDEADRVLRMKRLSQTKSCYPCRQRKVKCDHGQPCQTCQKRGHPQICTYGIDAPSKRRKQRSRRSGLDSEEHLQGKSQDGDVVAPSPERDELALRERRGTSEDGGEAAPLASVHPGNDALSDAQDHSSREELYAGDSSVLAVLSGTPDNPLGDMRREAGGILGLHNTLEVYPFAKLKTPQQLWASLLKIIPQQSEILRFFPYYRTSVYLFNPILVDLNAFESSISVYLEALGSDELQNPQKISQKWINKDSIARIGLLLATLAHGVHHSLMESSRRRSEYCLDLIQRSFEALRLANFMLRPSFDVVQALLVIGNCLQDYGQSDGSWVLLGTTVRLAQAMGLHTQSTEQLRGIECEKSRKIWEVVTRQDCLLSLCHGRPPIVSKRYWTNPFGQPKPDLSLSEMMRGIVSVTLDILAADSQPDCDASVELIAKLDEYQSRAAPHLQSRQNCTILQHHNEHLALRIHMGFFTSLLCRPVLARGCNPIDHPSAMILIARARDSLMSTARAFVDLQNISILPMRTWSMIHAALSATILLSMWEVTRNDPESRAVQQRVVEAFSRAAQEDDETGVTDASSNNSHWLSVSHARALVALQSALRKAPSLRQKSSVSDASREGVRRLNGHSRHRLFRDLQGNRQSESWAMILLLCWETGFMQIDTQELPWETQELSPLTYLDTIMNVPFQNFPQSNDPSGVIW
ncbi:hypothetical protein PT974_09772 [Cladobotryum mycophilum]|uniref:Zn(2)-C6 fungal-type domain-containing protein n=1 Tax=Cladobotryum mycophilum TaxID=491253 RepID=A0ABR0SHJ7_9HYPO